MSEETSDLRVFSPDTDESRVVSVTVGELRYLFDIGVHWGEENYMPDVDEIIVRERTCHMELIDEYGGGEEFTYAECPECGATFHDPEVTDDPSEVHPDSYRYCPNCGARVVD